jgi:hypothetical protein
MTQTANTIGAEGILLDTAEIVKITYSGTGNVMTMNGDAILLPAGYAVTRPISPEKGMIRYNYDADKFEGYQAGAWLTFGTSSSSFAVQNNGVLVGSRATVNFISGNNVTLDLKDDTVAGKINVIINSSSSSSNVANLSNIVDLVYAQANSSNVIAVSAFTQANTANSNAANASNIAIAAFIQANTGNAVPAFTQANTANSNAANAANIAIAAFAKANTGTSSGDANTPFAFGVANNAYSNVANLAVVVTSHNGAFTTVNTNVIQVNSNVANVAAAVTTANNIAIAAFAKANTGTGSSVPVGGSTDKVFWENDTVITTNYTITTDKNAGTFGPVTINSGVTVTIPSGSYWSIV